MYKNKMSKDFFIGNAVFIPDRNNNFFTDGYLLKGSIHYNFSDEKYETIRPVEPLDEKINKLCILIVSKNRLAVGLTYTYKEVESPVMLLRTFGVQWITKICKQNGIGIIYNKKIAENIFHTTDEYSAIPVDIWKYVAKIFVKLERKDKAFLEKIKYQHD